MLFAAVLQENWTNDCLDMLFVVITDAWISLFQVKFVEWDASEAACFVVRGIQEIKNQSRAQNYTMLHFIEVFKGTDAVLIYYWDWTGIGCYKATCDLDRMLWLLLGVSL